MPHLIPLLVASCVIGIAIGCFLSGGFSPEKRVETGRTEDRDTLPPGFDQSEPADLLASAVVQINQISVSFAQLGSTMDFVQHQVKQQGLVLGKQDRKIDAIETTVAKLKQSIARLEGRLKQHLAKWPEPL